MHILTGTYSTAHGSKYLQQLCKHFGHKIEVEYDAHQGTCIFELGKAFLTADSSGLAIRFELETAETVPLAKSVIDSHLVKFAFRENFETMTWSDT